MASYTATPLALLNDSVASAVNKTVYAETLLGFDRDVREHTNTFLSELTECFDMLCTVLNWHTSHRANKDFRKSITKCRNALNDLLIMKKHFFECELYAKKGDSYCFRRKDKFSKKVDSLEVCHDVQEMQRKIRRAFKDAL